MTPEVLRVPFILLVYWAVILPLADIAFCLHGADLLTRLVSGSACFILGIMAAECSVRGDRFPIVPGDEAILFSTAFLACQWVFFCMQAFFPDRFGDFYFHPDQIRLKYIGVTVIFSSFIAYSFTAAVSMYRSGRGNR